MYRFRTARTRALAALRPAQNFRSFEERIGIAVFALSLLFVMTRPLWAHEFKAGDIVIEHPWSRATPAGAKVAAGYFGLHNKGASADRLISVTAEIGGKAGIHEMAVDAGGVMTMRALESGLSIPAGGDVVLKPGAYHVMFEGLQAPLKAGDTFKGVLTFEKAGPITVTFNVEAMNKSPDHTGDADMGGMDMGGMDMGSDAH